MPNGNDSTGKKVSPLVKGYEELPLDRSEERPPAPAYVGRRPGSMNAPATPRIKTQPWLGIPVGSSTKSGLRCQNIDLEEAQETKENAERTSAEISAALAPNRVPNLSGLFDTVPEVGTYVDQLPVFQPIDEPSIEVQTEVNDTLRETVAIQGEGSLPDPIQARLKTNVVEPIIQSISPEPMLPPPPAVEETSVASKQDVYIPPAAPTQSIDNVGTNNTDALTNPPKAETKKSFLAQIGNSIASGWSSFTKAAKSILRKPATALTLAAGLVVGSGAIVATSQMTNGSDSRQEEVTSASSSSNSPGGTESALTPKVSDDQAGAVNLPPRVLEIEPIPVDTPKNDSSEHVGQPSKQTHEFSKNLKDAESPLVREIVESGTTTLRANLLGNTMIAPFFGIATPAQQAELSELTKSINLGMSVYFNEHFGTPDKVAESMKNPRLKNLYKSVKIMQSKGWVPTRLTQDKYPLEYKLASRIFADSSELGLDESDHPDQSVRDAVRGNIFRAKRPGAQVNFKKADGSYHVVMELVFEIMNDHSAKDSMSQKLAFADTSRLHQGMDLSEKPELRYASTPNFPVQSLPGKTVGVGAGVGVPYSNPVDTSDVDAGWDIPSSVELETASLPEPSINEIRAAFEKNLAMEVRVDTALSRMNQHKQVIEEVANKVAAMYPEADPDMVRGLVKRYGYIGFSIVSNDREAGVFQIKYNRPSLQTLKWTINHRRGMRRDVRLA